MVPKTLLLQPSRTSKRSVTSRRLFTEPESTEFVALASETARRKILWDDPVRGIPLSGLTPSSWAAPPEHRSRARPGRKKDGAPYIVSEYMAGGDLAALLRGRQSASPAESGQP